MFVFVSYPSIEIKPQIDFIKKAFGATNPAVRTAAINLLGVIYMYLGAQLRVFFESEKPALLKQIDEAFEKVELVLDVLFHLEQERERESNAWLWGFVCVMLYVCANACERKKVLQTGRKIFVCVCVR